MMRDIPGYEGLYAATSCGKIWSHYSKRFLKPAGGDNYQMVTLFKNKVQHSDYVHRLVAITYLPNPDNYTEINHKDDVKYHNWVHNLEWCTRKYNISYGNCYKSKCIPVYCVELDKTFISYKDAANQLGISVECLGSCIRGHTKTAGGFHWKKA